MFENNNNDDLILEKLIILYTLNNVEEDISETQLIHIISGTDVMNYFTLMALIPKMIESEFIAKYSKNGTILFSITQRGLEVLTYFENRIPEFFRDKIKKYIDENKEDIFSTLVKKQAGYTMQNVNEFLVTLIVIKGREKIMSMNFTVDSESEAKELCRKWNLDYIDKYNKIIEILHS